MSLLSIYNAKKALLVAKLTNKGVSGVSVSDGLTTLINSIDDIQTGGGCSDILTIDDSLADTYFRPTQLITDVNIPAGTTELGSYAFAYWSNLTSLTIPESVTTIDASCFEKCTALESVNIPSGVTALPRDCFNGCDSLESIEIPAGITSIGNNCFNWCSSLTSIKFNSTTPPTIGYNAFNAVTATVSVPFGSLSAYETALANFPNLTIVERGVHEPTKPDLPDGPK